MSKRRYPRSSRRRPGALAPLALGLGLLGAVVACGGGDDPATVEPANTEQGASNVDQTTIPVDPARHINLTLAGGPATVGELKLHVHDIDRVGVSFWAIIDEESVELMSAPAGSTASVAGWTVTVIRVGEVSVFFEVVDPDGQVRSR